MNRLGIYRFEDLFGESFFEFINILFLAKDSVGLITFDREQFKKSFLSPDFVRQVSELLVRPRGLALSFEILFERLKARLPKKFVGGFVFV